MSTLSAVVFDFDGTIADTEAIEYECWRAEFVRHGAQLRLDEWMQCVGAGPGAWDPLDALMAATGGAAEPGPSLQRVRGAVQKQIRRLLPRPGVPELIEEIAAQGVPLAVASSSSSAWVHGLLGQLGLGGWFQAVATRDEVGRAKPAPDLFDLALRRLGSDPRRSVAIEDSPNGAKAAHAAGLAVVVVPNLVTASSEFPVPHVRYETFEGLTAAELERYVGCC